MLSLWVRVRIPSLSLRFPRRRRHLEDSLSLRSSPNWTSAVSRDLDLRRRPLRPPRILKCRHCTLHRPRPRRRCPRSTLASFQGLAQQSPRADLGVLCRAAVAVAFRPAAALQMPRLHRHLSSSSSSSSCRRRHRLQSSRAKRRANRPRVQRGGRLRPRLRPRRPRRRRWAPSPRRLGPRP